MGTVWMAEQTQPVRRKVALKLIKAGMDSQVRPGPVRGGAAGPGPDGPPQHRQGARRRRDRGRPALLRHGVRQGRADHAVLRRRPAEHPRERLELFVPVCQAVQHAHTEGDHPPRPEAVERPGGPLRRQAGAQGDRLRRGQGDRADADRADDAHAGRPARRHAAVHEPRAGRAQRPGRRHPERHLLAGRAPLRTADRHDAAREEAAQARPRSTRSCGSSARKSRQTPSTAAARRRRQLPRIAARRGDGAGQAGPAGQGRPRLDRDEGAGEGPRPALRDGQRPGDGRAALPGRRAGDGLPAVGALPAAEVRAAEQGAGPGGLPGRPGPGGRHHRHDLGHDPRHRRALASGPAERAGRHGPVVPGAC